MDNVEPVGEAYNLDPNYHKMSDFLGVNVYDRSNSELAKKVNYIHDWAEQKSGKKDITDTLWQVRSLQRELGHNFIGKPLITEMYKYLKLKSDHDQPRTEQVSPPAEVQKEIKVVKKENPKKASSIQKAVAETVQQSVTQMVNGIISDKKMIQGAVQNALKEAFK